MAEYLEPIAPQEGRQELAMNIKASLIIFGGAAGSGKSRLLLMRPLLHINDPEFTGVIFRRTQEALKKGGSVWPESKKLYSRFKTQVNNKDRTHIFKEQGGGVLAFDGLNQVGDEEKNYQGSQLGFIGFDEGTHFEESQVMYMYGRLRSAADFDAYCMITCNPDPDSWLLKWVKPYLDEEGYPIRELGGKIRYFITIEETPVLSDTKEWLIENYPDQCYVSDSKGNKTEAISTYTFIDGNIYDNPALLDNEPTYLAKLKGQSRVNQARLLHGSWYAREEAAGYWKRDWCDNKLTPLKVVSSCRAYDKAGSVPSEVYRYPDYTASIKMSKDAEGYYYIQGNFLPEFCDEGSNVLGRVRRRAGDRDKLIQDQAEYDGTDVSIVFPQDPGQAGKTEFIESSKPLVADGFIVKADPMPYNKGKLTKFTPFASACELGLVYIDKSSFPNEETYNAYCKELEQFDGTRSTNTRKDDWADATASAFNYLVSAKVNPTPSLPDDVVDVESRYSSVMRNNGNHNFGESLMNRGGTIV